MGLGWSWIPGTPSALNPKLDRFGGPCESCRQQVGLDAATDVGKVLQVAVSV